MGNVTFNSIASSVGGAGNFIASAITRNFANVVSAVNSGSLNSNNYGAGASAFESYHVAISNVVAGHFPDGAIPGVKIATSQVLSQHAYYRTSDTGILAVRKLDNAPYGIHVCPMSKSWEVVATNSTNSTSFAFVYSSDGFYGNPSFTTTPRFFAAPLLEWATQTAGAVVEQFQVTKIDSTGASIMLAMDAVLAVGNSLTFHMALIGERSA